MAYELPGLFAKLVLDKSGWTKGFQEADKESSGFISAVTLDFKQMAKDVATAVAAMAAAATAAFVGISVKGAQFEDKIKNVSLRTGESMDEIARKVRALAVSSEFSANEIADALMGLSASGVSGADAMKAIAPALQFADNEAYSLSQTVGMLGQVLVSFNMNGDQSTRILDMLTTAMKESGLRVESLGTALQQVAGPAREAGLTLEETIGIMGLLTTKGFTGRKLAAEMNEMLGGMTDPDKLARLEMMREEAAKFIETLERSGGAMAEKASQDVDDVAESWEKLVNQITEAALNLYDAWKKPLKDILVDVQDLFRDINRELEENKAPIAAFAEWVKEKFLTATQWIREYVHNALLAAQGISTEEAPATRPTLKQRLMKTWRDLFGDTKGSAGMASRLRKLYMDMGGRITPEDTLDSAAAAGEEPPDIPSEMFGTAAAGFPSKVGIAKTNAEKDKETLEEVKHYTDEIDDMFGDMYESMKEKAKKAGEQLWREAEERKIALGKMWKDLGASFGSDFLDVMAQKLAGFEVSWSDMWQNMKYQMIKTFMATGKLDFGGMLGGMFGKSSPFSTLFGGGVAGKGIFGGATSSVMSWLGPLAVGIPLIGSLTKRKTVVEIDKRAEAEAYQQEIDASRAQLSELIQQQNMGELNLDEATLDAIAGFQFQDVQQGFAEFNAGGKFFGKKKVQQYLISNESALKDQMARFQELMGRVQGTNQFEQLARENTFTGAGYMTVNNFSNNVQGNQVVNDASMNDLARDLGRRMIKLGLVAAGTV